MRALIGAATTSGQGSPAAGIVLVDVSPDGRLTPVGYGAASVENPMYQAWSADRDIVYTVHEVADGGWVSAWWLDGVELRPLGEAQSTGGAGSCHVSIHPSGRYVLVADYSSGSVSALPIRDDGSVGECTSRVQHTGSGPNTERQEGPHAHMAVTDPGTGPGRGHVLVTDLGTDTFYRYQLDEASGHLSAAGEVRVPDGAGPRHLVVHGQYAYVVNELASTVSTIDLETNTVVGSVSTTATDQPGLSQPSAARISADGRYLYVANRGVDEIAVISVDGANLALVATVPCGGAHPRDLVLDPSGRYLFAANQFGDVVTSFRIDRSTGLPESAGTELKTPSPACVTFI